MFRFRIVMEHASISTGAFSWGITTYLSSCGHGVGVILGARGTNRFRVGHVRAFYAENWGQRGSPQPSHTEPKRVRFADISR
jgi:hypothetical protein